MIGALILGLVAGIIGRALVPNDAFQDMKGPLSWLVSVLLGLVGAFVGYMIFTRGLGIGDDDAFDLGGILSAIIGVVIVLLIATFVINRVRHGRPQRRRGHARGY
ncbi:MAG TPA: GlsB/YeaQ/YmgE family stress response membrane protein [Ilumatobacteraceae bacterium]|nr:GlsB/YeaQ/YmgE family stress response membrane protein [Ilumatobacteraceae bacterium]